MKMFRKEKKRTTNESDFIDIVMEMATLDDIYPELGTPSRVRKMIHAGVFSIENRPWDFLIGMGYAMINLDKESGPESRQAISLLRDKMEKTLKSPALWMIDIITPEVEARYLKVSGKNLPKSVLPHWRTPTSLKGKTFSRDKYSKLEYVIRGFCRCPFTIYLPTSNGEYWGILGVREMYYLVASMENPPKEILAELIQELVVEAKFSYDDLD